MKFKDLLKQRDMTAAQVARRIGLTPAAVSSWCREITKPGYDMLPAIAKALGVSVERVIKCFI